MNDITKPDMRLKENRTLKQNQAISQPSLKKGNPTWSPANVSEIYGKEDGYRYRKLRKDPTNIANKKLEGWEIVSGINGANTTVEVGAGRINDGQGITSVREGTDWVLARITEETAQSRDDYYNKENARRVSGLTAHVKKEVGKEGAATHGAITVSSREGEQVYD